MFVLNNYLIVYSKYLLTRSRANYFILFNDEKNINFGFNNKSLEARQSIMLKVRILRKGTLFFVNILFMKLKE